MSAITSISRFTPDVFACIGELWNSSLRYYRTRMRAKSIDKVRSLSEAIRWAENELNNAGVHCGHGTDNTRDEAAWLVAAAAGLTPMELGDRVKEAPSTQARTRLQ